MALKSRLAEFRNALPGVADRIAQRTAQVLLDERNLLVPVDTSALKNSGEIITTGNGARTVREGRGINDARAAFTEYGTSRQAAQPHMTPASETARDAMPKIGADELRGIVK